MSLDDCFKKGLLRKTNIEKEKIENSVSRAEHFLERAKGNFKNDYFDVAFLLAYTSMFHTARALLFSKGYKERSHYCLILLLKKEFGESEEILTYLKLVDSYRVSRHSIQYAGGTCSKIDAEEALDDAEKFLEIVLDSEVLFKS